MEESVDSHSFNDNSNTSRQFISKYVQINYSMWPIPSTVLSQISGLQPLDSCECDFEYRWNHCCSFLVIFLYCVNSGLFEEEITHSEKFYRMCVA